MLTYLLISLIVPCFFICKAAYHSYIGYTYTNPFEMGKATDCFIAFMASLFIIALVFSIAYLKAKAHV